MEMQTGVEGSRSQFSVGVLAAGDLLAFIAFVVLGRIVHAGCKFT